MTDKKNKAGKQKAKVSGHFDGRYELSQNEMNAENGFEVLKLNEQKKQNGKAKHVHRLEISRRGMLVIGSHKSNRLSHGFTSSGGGTDNRQMFPLELISRFFVYNLNKSSLVIATEDEDKAKRWASVLMLKSPEDTDLVCNWIEEAKRSHAPAGEPVGVGEEDDARRESDEAAPPHTGQQSRDSLSSYSPPAGQEPRATSTHTHTHSRTHSQSQSHHSQDGADFVERSSLREGSIRNDYYANVPAGSPDDEEFMMAAANLVAPMHAAPPDTERAVNTPSTVGAGKERSTSTPTPTTKKTPLQIDYVRLAGGGGGVGGGAQPGSTGSSRSDAAASLLRFEPSDWIIEEASYNAREDGGFERADNGSIYLYCARTIRPVNITYAECDSDGDGDGDGEAHSHHSHHSKRELYDVDENYNGGGYENEEAADERDSTASPRYGGAAGNDSSQQMMDAYYSNLQHDMYASNPHSQHSSRYDSIVNNQF